MKPMTRKEAIKRLKRIQILSSNEAQAALSLAIRDLESLEGGIRAKALRKKGTDKWYYLSDKGKILSNDKWPSHFGNPKDLLRVFNIANVKLPPDAVLVDIIIVTPKNE
jgi:hypothetical protein